MLQVKYPNQIHLIRGNHEAGCGRFEGVGPGTNSKADFRPSQGLNIWKMNEHEWRGNAKWWKIIRWGEKMLVEHLISWMWAEPAELLVPLKSTLRSFAPRRIQQSMPSTDSVMNADAASTRPGWNSDSSWAPVYIICNIQNASFFG